MLSSLSVCVCRLLWLIIGSFSMVSPVGMVCSRATYTRTHTHTHSYTLTSCQFFLKRWIFRPEDYGIKPPKHKQSGT